MKERTYKTKRIISLFLAALMLLSLCTAAFADTAAADTAYPEYDSIFAIGDSNSMGYGLDGYQGDSRPMLDENGNQMYKPNGDPIIEYYIHREKYLNFVEGSYPDLVADKLGIAKENRNNLSYPAFRSKDACFYLKNGVDFTNDDYFNENYRKWYIAASADSGIVPNEDIYRVGDNFVNQLKYKEGDKKLVLLYVGSSDVFFTALGAVRNKPEMADLSKSAKTIVEKLYEGYNGFLKYVPQLLQHIKKLNPEADIVMVGTFNPMKDVRLSADFELPVLDAFGVLTGLMNQNLKHWAEKYGCKFADITNVETRTLENGYVFNDLFTKTNDIIHATPEGYEYIARQILKSLEVKKPAVSRDIVVDLGAAKKIKSVIVGTTNIKNYSYKDNVLTIPYNRTNAMVMTVTADMGGGRTALFTYQLSYNKSTGYTAYKLYSSSDIVKSVTSTVTGTAKTIVNTLCSIFKPFFK